MNRMSTQKVLSMITQQENSVLTLMYSTPPTILKSQQFSELLIIDLVASIFALMYMYNKGFNIAFILFCGNFTCRTYPMQTNFNSNAQFMAIA